MKPLAALLTELENQLQFIERKKENISQVTVGWHLEHSLLALVKMITAVEHSNPADYKYQFNMKRLIVLTMGKIPRGRAKVPESVKPAEGTTIENIKGLLEKAKQKVILFETFEQNKFFTHPVFGDVKLKQARKVIAIHTNHHLQIINDILKGG